MDNNQKNFRKSFLTGAFLLVCAGITAQIYYFDNYSVSEGLAQSKVFVTIQDRNDYIWLGTEGGVSRFDGKVFENFTSEDGLAINGVRTIFEDTTGTLWLGHTGGGLSRYVDRQFEVIEKADSLIGSTVTSINCGPGGEIWITTETSGAFSLAKPSEDAEDLQFVHHRGGRLGDQVFGSYTGRDGSIYLITIPDVHRKRPGAEEFERIRFEGMGYFQVTSFLEDKRGNLWFGTHNDGLYKYIPESDEFTFYNTRNGLAFNFVSTLFEDSEGYIWAGTWGGGLSRVRDDEIMTFNLENGLQDLKIWSVMEDVEGNILIGTNENGLSIFKGEQFISFSERNGLVNEQVSAVLQDSKGKYWFGTNAGISIYDPDKPAGKEFRHISAASHAISDQVRFLKEDREGHIWVGTNGGGTFEYVPGTGKFIFPPRVNTYNVQSIVTAMEIDRENNLWVGTTDGLIYYEIDARKVAYLTQIHGLSGTDISAIFADTKGILWVGAKGKGISTIEGDSISMLELETEFTPTCFTETSDGRIWIGTEGQGIYTLKDGKVVGHITRRDGLLANLITLVTVDEADNIYIGTNKGLNKYLTADEKIFTYTEKSGFTGIETRNNASIRDAGGNLWFGTVGGVFKYDLSKERHTGIEPLTHITRMRVNLEEREMVGGLKLGYKENSIIFDYYSICLTNPEAVSYQYMLKGADQNWLPSDITTATYPALRPGKYKFKVKARNSEGIWNETPISYAFQIKPPFYATWYFILSCVALGAILIFAYIKWRTARLRRENLILEEKVKVRTAQVVAQKEELAQKNKDITDSIRYAKRIQFAILPPEVPFEDTFILFKPKDIVSGDFYWLLEMSGKEFIAAVDCTGHGVPGAFMSIIGHNMLNKVVKEYGVDKPSEILKQLDAEVTKTLRQEESATVKDGMDMTLIAYHKEKKLLEFSGAYNPIYLIRNGELIETKGDRFAIGRSELFQDKDFTNHEIKIRKGDTIYLFSDGYADQFGGRSGKKFKIQPMKELILNIQEKSMDEQRSILDSTIEAWRGNIEQVDDILIIGRRF